MDPEPGWTRHGECTHCGWCCTTLLHPVSVRYAQSDVFPRLTEEYCNVRGIEVHQEIAGVPVYLQFTGDLINPCPKYRRGAEPGDCTIHDSKPQYCKDYPLIPQQVVETPCSYWFEHEDGRVVCGQGASPEVQVRAHSSYEERETNP